jgi:hypothetical protein
VADYQLPRAVSSTHVKHSPQFTTLVETLREGFDPEGRKHIADFNLTHPDAFRTLTKDEYRG